MITSYKVPSFSYSLCTIGNLINECEIKTITYLLERLLVKIYEFQKKHGDKYTEFHYGMNTFKYAVQEVETTYNHCKQFINGVNELGDSISKEFLNEQTLGMKHEIHCGVFLAKEAFMRIKL